MTATAELRAAAYCRVSTDKAEQAGSLNSQIAFFEEYITRCDSMTLVKVYYDEGASGTTTAHRSGFNEMIAKAMAGMIDIILTKEVSRFARNTVDTLNVTRMLRANGVGVIFINDNIDTRDSDGELRLSIMATIAQEESRKISERVKWGQQRKMEQGVVFGRSCLGYDVSNGKISISDVGSKTVQRIFNEYTILGKGADSIAKALNSENIPSVNGGRWSAGFIRRVLRNEKYAGDLVQKKTCTPDYLTHKKKCNKEGRIYIHNHHEPIIDRSLWEKTQAELERRAPGDTSRHSDRYRYSGKVYCGICGSVMVSRVKKLKNGDIYHALRCSGRINGKRCDNETLNTVAMRICIKHILDSLKIDKKAINEAVVKKLSQCEKCIDNTAIKRKTELLLNKKRRAVDLMLDGLITAQELAEQKAYYDRQIEQLNSGIADSGGCRDTEKISRRIQELLDFSDDSVWRIIDRAVYAHNTLTLYFCKTEKGFMTDFKAKGRGESYSVITGDIKRVQRIITDMM